MNRITKIIGERIRLMRSNYGWSQEELAHRANLHPSYIGSIERGEKSATIESLEKIISALNTTFEDFFRFSYMEDSDRDMSVLFKITEKLYKRDINDQKMILNLIDLIMPWKDSD